MKSGLDASGGRTSSTSNLRVLAGARLVMWSKARTPRRRLNALRAIERPAQAPAHRLVILCRDHADLRLTLPVAPAAIRTVSKVQVAAT